MGANIKIDFVVTWVDSNDPEWIATYNHYRPEKAVQDKPRFRNWDIFRYWFRAVEQYTPWVNKVYLVTNGTFPKWINAQCEKLVLINHADYMPAKYLPTFNSNAIELNLFRIDSLSEHFVLFNDDMFINAHIEPDYYFKNGLPCDFNFETPYHNLKYTDEDQYGINVTNICNIAVLNKHFNRKETTRNSWKNWYGCHLWGKPFFMSLLMMGRQRFENFVLLHLEQPFLKSVFKEIWDKEYHLLDESSSRFRDTTNLNQYLMRYWQFASNRFYPAKKKGLAYHYYSKEIVEDLIKNLLNKDIWSICINDTPFFSDEEYKYAKEMIGQAFEKKFPHISMFEKE